MGKKLLSIGFDLILLVMVQAIPTSVCASEHVTSYESFEYTGGAGTNSWYGWTH